LAAFLVEAGLSEDDVELKPGAWTIEKILEEKRQYDASLAYEKKGDDLTVGWPQPAPTEAMQPESLTITSNVLYVGGGRGSSRADQDSVFVTTADRSWECLSTSPPFQSTDLYANAHGSPILSLSSIKDGFIYSTSMSGQLMVHHRSGQLIDKVRDHLKYAVQVVSGYTSQGRWVVATAGWDQKVHLYSPEQELVTNLQPERNSSLSARSEPLIPGFLRDPIHTISTPTVPESIVLVEHPDSHDLYLILSRRDSTFLYYYCITPISTESSSARTSEVSFSVQETGRQNLAPHSNAWVAFTPSCLAPCPTDPTLLAVATSHLPHMKLLVVRLLFPKGSYTPSNSSAEELQSQTQASQARAALAIQDREDAAIKLHVTTMAPQTPYSTPQVVWRPGGQGVFVNADDGVIRGVDTQSGKVVALLKGHEVGSKVRTLWAGWEGQGSEGRSELLVSGGFDKKVLFWRVGKSIST
jgi:WD40 repeat protein